MAEKRPIAIVTGGSRGIGLGIAGALARNGFDIAITGIDGAEVTAAAIDALTQMGARTIALHADLSDLTGHQATVDTIRQQLGPIDCLVNHAGMASVVRGDFLQLAPENFDAIVATNLRGTVFFTQAVTRTMLADSDAANRSVITITSVSAALSSPERLDYCITKAGLSAFSQGLALRLAETGIAVFEVRPGIIRSDMTAPVSGKYDALIADGLVPMKRWGEAADIGDMVAGLAGGRFGFATGSVIHADGGLSIGRF
jgi:NAD(P)-dependent dehydrogenase (short-subunit alcohol dehydrogenase family)